MTVRPLSIDTLSLDRFGGVTFDLFGTIVRLNEGRLPCLTVGDTAYRTLLAAVLECLAEDHVDVAPSDAVLAYNGAVQDTTCRLRASGGRELSAHWTFSRFLERLDLSDAALASALSARFMNATVAAAEAVDGLMPLLATLRTRGLSLGLVSNLADADGGRRLLARLGLEDAFDAVVFSGDLGWRKPDARIFRHVAGRLGHAPGALLHIGDEWQADVLGASAAGFGVLWVADANRTTPVDTNAGAWSFADFAFAACRPTDGTPMHAGAGAHADRA